MASTIQVCVKDELKTKSDALFKKLGTDTASAIRIFLIQAIANNGFPFEIKLNQKSVIESLEETEILEKLEKSRKHISEGKFRNADDMISDMRGKYDL